VLLVKCVQTATTLIVNKTKRKERKRKKERGRKKETVETSV
jgi:hypothetical protein